MWELIIESKISQIHDCVQALQQFSFCQEELDTIDKILRN